MRVMRSYLLLFVLTSFFYSCSKSSDSTLVDLQSILQNHQWYKDETRKIIVDTSFHGRSYDTTYSSSICEKTELMNFLPDSLFRTTPLCAFGVGYGELSGTWVLRPDSLFAGYAVIHLAGGLDEIHFGVENSKLLEIDDAHFVAKRFQRFYYQLGVEPGIQHLYDHTEITTYKSVR